MMEQITRQQRRALDRYAAGIDRVTAEDRAWFERHPERWFRMRRMVAAEIGSAAAVASLNPVSADAGRFTLVRKVTPNFRLRIHILGPASKGGDETGEAVCAALWGHHLDRSPIARASEAAAIAAALRHGQPSPNEGGAQA